MNNRISRSNIVWILLLLNIITATAAAGNEGIYNILKIPPVLLLNANAVVRNYSLTFEVENEEEANLKCIYAITILNSKGQHYGMKRLTYDNFRSVENFECRLYDGAGNQISELDDDEIRDRALISWTTLYSESRVKTAELYHDEYPYTIEFEYEIEYNGYINWPEWIPEEEDASVEYSSYNIIIPSGNNLRFLAFNTDEKPKVTKLDDSKVSYFWSVSKLPKFKVEPIGPPQHDQFISVITAPSKFKMDDYEGDLSSWENFGKWIWDLWKSKQNLNENDKKEILSLTEGVTDKKEIVKKLYKFLQSKTHYINIIIGIGGWMPIEADKVYANGFGDCKALTNLMISMLDCAGIKAYPALIYNNPVPYRVEKSFSCNQFNHVIAFVPLEADTVWLECTSQNFPFNHVGAGNENRYALLISNNGGKLIKTPTSVSTTNKLIRTATVTLQPNGKGAARISAEYSGNRQDEISYVFNDLSSENFNDWLKYELDIPSYNINSKKIFQSDENNSSTTLSVELSLNNYASSMGSRLFFDPMLIRSRFSVPESVEKRKYPVMFSYPFCEIDSLVYEIPEGSSVEAKPEDININSEYFEFHCRINTDDLSKLVYYRFFEIKSAQIPAEKYDELRNFIQTVIQSDSRKVVLVKK